MKLTHTPHKRTNRLSNCHTEKPSHDYTNTSPSKFPSPSTQKSSQNPNHNKENFNEKSPANIRNPGGKTTNPSKILKILNLTTKYEGSERDPPVENSSFKNNSHIINPENIENKPEKRNSVKKKESPFKEIQTNNPHTPKKSLELEEVVKDPVGFWNTCHDRYNCETFIGKIVDLMSVKGLMVLFSLFSLTHLDGKKSHSSRSRHDKNLW